MAAILYFVPVLAPIKNPISMTWMTPGPNLVLLEESEPKYPEHPWPMYIYKDNTGFLIQALIDSNTHMTCTYVKHMPHLK